MEINKKELEKRLNLFTFVRDKMIPVNATYLKMVCEDNVLTLTGTDMRNTVIAKMDIVSDDFRILVKYKMFKSLLKTHGENVEITVDKNYVNMRSKGLKNKLVIIADKFPNDPNFIGESGLKMKSVRYVTALKRAINASIDTPQKPSLGGVYVFGDDDKTTIIGSDTKHTAITEINTETYEGYDYMLGKESVAILTKVLKYDMEVFYDEFYIVVVTELCTVYCRKFKETYMDTSSIFVDVPDTTVETDWALFKSYVDNCRVINDDFIEITVNDKVELSAYGTVGNSDMSLEGDITGNGSEIKLDVGKLLAGLNMIKSKVVYFEIGLNQKYAKSLVLYDGDFRYIMRARR